MNDALTNSIRYPLAALALAVVCGNGAADDDFINVRNPVTLPARIAAQRVPVGITGDYKPCLGLLPSGELLLVNYYYKPETGDGKSRPEIRTRNSRSKRLQNDAWLRLAAHLDNLGALLEPSGRL